MEIECGKRSVRKCQGCIEVDGLFEQWFPGICPIVVNEKIPTQGQYLCSRNRARGQLLVGCFLRVVDQCVVELLPANIPTDKFSKSLQIAKGLPRRFQLVVALTPGFQKVLQQLF